MKVEINKKRLEYLLALYKMSVDDLLSLLNKGRKRITEPQTSVEILLIWGC